MCDDEEPQFMFGLLRAVKAVCAEALQLYLGILFLDSLGAATCTLFHSPTWVYMGTPCQRRMPKMDLLKLEYYMRSRVLTLGTVSSFVVDCLLLLEF